VWTTTGPATTAIRSPARLVSRIISAMRLTPTSTRRSDEISFVGASELRALAEKAGLAVETEAQDYEMSALSSDAERIILVARAGAA